MGARRFALFAGLALFAVSCVNDSGEDPIESATTTVPGETSEVPSTSATPTTSSDLARDVRAQRFEVDGVEVWTRSSLDELPRQATEVRFTSLFRDNGDGLELCIGNVGHSIPPQCGGPVVEGLDPTGWAETASGFAFGERTVVVAWPIDDGALRLISHGPPTHPVDIPDNGPTSTPVNCRDLGQLVGADSLERYAAENPDKTAGVRDPVGGPATLYVVEEYIEDAATELRTSDAEPCLIPVIYSTEKLEGIKDQLLPKLALPTLPIIGLYVDEETNSVSVTLTVADLNTVEEVLAAVDDPAALTIDSVGEVLAGSSD